MTSRLRVALVGTDGAGGQEHQRTMYAPALRSHPAFAVIGVVDDAGATASDRERAVRLGAELDLPVLESLDAALDGADLACVCTPYARREAVIFAAAERGVHLLIDKPAGLSPDQCRRIADIVARHPVIAMPAHHLRFHPTVQRTIAAVARGDVGLPWAVQGEFLAAEGTWTWPLGELANFCCYPLDIVRAVLALEPTSVAAFRSSPFFDNAEEDLAVLSLAFEHDVSVSLTVGRTPVRAHRNGPLGEHRYRVMGTEGVLTMDLAAPALSLEGPVARRPYGRTSLAAMLDHLVAAIRGEVRPALGPADAVVVADVVASARRAADQSIVVPLDTSGS